jgi:hypothetical protein
VNAVSKKRPKNSYSQWDHLPIEFPIHETQNYIVFLDAKLEVEWETSSTYDAEKREPEGFTEVMRRYSDLESSINDGMSHGNRKQAERLVALGIDAGLKGDVAAAHRSMDAAAEFIQRRNQEIGKRLYVAAAARATLAFVLVAATAWVCRRFVEPLLGELPFSLVLYGAGGSVGALFFVLRGVGLALPDPQADEPLHVMEATCRIALGVLGAVVVCLAARTGLLLGPVMTLPHANYFLMLVAIVAGRSETLAPDLMLKLETSVKKSTPPRLKGKK